MQAINRNLFNWPNLTLLGGDALAQEKTQRFHFFLPIYYQKCIQMLLGNGKMIFPVLKRPNRTHRSNPQLFNTSNLLSANLSRQNLSSPMLPQRFICSRITHKKIPDHPHSSARGGLGSSSPPRRAPPGEGQLITAQVNELTLSLATPWVSRCFLEGTAWQGPHHQKTLLHGSSKKLITTKLPAFNPINKTHRCIIIILGT